MAVAISAQDTVGLTVNGTPIVSPTNYTGLTVNSGDTDLIIFVTWGINNVAGTFTASSAVWDQGGTNQTMTAVATPIESADSTCIVGIWYLANPTPGNKTFRVSYSYTGGGTILTNIFITGMSFTGGGTSNGAATNFSSTVNETITITSATGDYCVSSYSQNNYGYTTTGESGTMFCYKQDGTNGVFACIYAAGAATVTMFPGNRGTGPWVAMGVNIAPGGATTWQGTSVLAGAGIEVPLGNLAESGFINAPGIGAMLGPTVFDSSFMNSANAFLSNNYLTVTSVGAGANTSARSDGVVATPGKIYCEFTMNAIAGTSGVGICNASQGTGTSLQASLNAICYSAADGNVYINSVSVSTLLTYTTGDIIDMAVDAGNTNIWFRKNGGPWNNNGAANPAANTGGISISTLNAGPYYAAVEVRGTDSITANFGATPFQ